MSSKAARAKSQPAAKAKSNKSDNKLKPVAVGVDRSQAAKALLNHCVGFVVNTKVLGVKRKADKSKIITNADKELLNLTKTILECPEYKAITQYDRSIRAYIESQCLPSVFKRGHYFVKKTALEKVMKECEAKRVGREELVDEFKAVYDDVVNDALDRLKDQGNRSDYPNVSQIRDFFSFDFRTARFDVDPAIREISESLYAEEVKKVEAQLGYAAEEIIGTLRGKALEVVEHLIDRLTPDQTGKKKTFKKNSFENILEFVALFNSAKNGVEDAALAAQLKTLESLMTDADPKAIRSSDEMRTQLQTKLNEVKGEIDKLVVMRPTRRYRDFDTVDA